MAIQASQAMMPFLHACQLECLVRSHKPSLSSWFGDQPKSAAQIISHRGSSNLACKASVNDRDEVLHFGKLATRWLIVNRAIASLSRSWLVSFSYMCGQDYLIDAPVSAGDGFSFTGGLVLAPFSDFGSIKESEEIFFAEHTDITIEKFVHKNLNYSWESFLCQVNIPMGRAGLMNGLSKERWWVLVPYFIFWTWLSFIANFLLHVINNNKVRMSLLHCRFRGGLAKAKSKVILIIAPRLVFPVKSILYGRSLYPIICQVKAFPVLGSGEKAKDPIFGLTMGSGSQSPADVFRYCLLLESSWHQNWLKF